VAGLVLVRQRPGTAKGICFITVEDECGTANLVVFEKLFNQYRNEILQSRLLMVEGKLQKEGEVVHVIVQRCYNLTPLLSLLSSDNKTFPQLAMSRSDERTEPLPDARSKPQNGDRREVFYKGRNFK
jgi:error-prone DNA polymerase